jgi:ribosomal protein S17E
MRRKIKRIKMTLIEKIDQKMSDLDWMKNNAIVQGWNLGRRLRK